MCSKKRHRKNLLNLRDGEDNKEKTLESVKKNIKYRGANLWILACAIIIASIGLNVNSTAVVIGAMLISPLMGPIVGAGFALAIFDFTLLRKSLINLFIATVVSLLVSTIYFFIFCQLFFHPFLFINCVPSSMPVAPNNSQRLCRQVNP